MSRPLFPLDEPIELRLTGRPLVIMLDVDGTLAPIAPRPDAATVPPETRRTISALAACNGVHVALVSGRAAADARRMVGVAAAWVIGNHGYQLAGPQGEEVLSEPELEGYQRLVAQAAGRIGPLVRTVPGVIFENKIWTLSIHYRLAPREVIPRLRASVSETAAQLGLRVTEGKEVLEVRPPARVDKGTAVLLLAARLGGLDETASLLYVGDDATDEDAFRALRHRTARAVTVRVRHESEGPSVAEFTVRDTDEVRQLLDWLLATRRPSRSAAARPRG